jgi:ATP-dependent Clp protease ATP-binding subunit ClpA
MFERFTQEARSVVTAAQTEARSLRHDSIGSEHLLLSLTLSKAGVVAKVLNDFGLNDDRTRALVEQLGASQFSGAPDPGALATIGIDLHEVRRSVEEAFGPGALERTKAARGRIRGRRGHLPFRREAKTALELALREALALGHRHIGAEHILLGLLRNTGSRAHLILAEAGADAKAIRESIIRKIAA